MALSISELDWGNLSPVRVAHLIDPGAFWVVPLEDVKFVEDLETSLTDFCGYNPFCEVASITAGELVAVPHPKTGKWMRAEVQDVSGSLSLLFLMDHGMVINMNTHNLRPLPIGFHSKFHAVRLHLRGVQPVYVKTTGLWSSEAYAHVSALLYAAEGCYLHTAKNAVDIADPVVFGTLVVQANNRMVDLGVDLEQRGFATRSKLNAITAYENFVKEQLCLGPDVRDPRQVSNPMKSSSVQAQVAYEATSQEQRKVAETVGRGSQRPAKTTYEQRPVQYIPGGYNLNRVPQTNSKRVAKSGARNSPPLKSSSQSSPYHSGVGAQGGQVKSPIASRSCRSPEMGSASAKDNTLSRESSSQSLWKGDGSFADISMSSSCDSSMTTLSAGESPLGGLPTRRQFKQLIPTTDSFDSLDLSSSVGSLDASLLATDVSILSMDSLDLGPSKAKGGTKRRDAILAMAEAHANSQPALVSDGDAANTARSKHWNLVDKFREDFRLESDNLASVSQHLDESVGNLSLMNVSEVKSATPVKMSLSERYKLIAEMESVSTPKLPGLATTVSAASVQAMSSADLWPTATARTLYQSRRDHQPPTASVSVNSASAGAGDAYMQAPVVESVSKCNIPTVVLKEKQMLLYRLKHSAPQPSLSEVLHVAPQSSQMPQNPGRDQQNIEPSLSEVLHMAPQSSQMPQNPRKDQPNLEESERVLVKDGQGLGKVADSLPKGLVALTLATNRVLVHGKAVQQIQSVRSAPFPLAILEALSMLKVQHPTRLQQVTWPAIFRGDDVVMVAQHTAGMTLAYLAPLTALLAQPSRYKALRESSPGYINGPLAVILCPGFEQCHKVEKICGLLLRDMGITVVTAYGGGAEQEKEAQLINGCDVLVTTPLCFFRLLAYRKLMVNLKCICHIVLSNADRLIEKFKKQLVLILESCKESVRRRKEKGGSPNGLQVLAASNRWSLELYSMVNAIVPHPLVVIGSYLEAAIYAGVRPKLDIRLASAKMELVFEILSEQRGLHKSVVACRDASKVEEVAEMLTRKEFYVLQAHEQMMGFVRDDVRQEWEKVKPGTQRPVLVVSDPVLEDLLIADAVVLVHFDMPASKNGFGKRFSLLMDNYPSIHTADKNTVQDCRAHVLVDEANSEQLPGIVDFMRRLGATIMPILDKTAKEAKLDRERSKSHLPFCANMKAFGECSQDWNLCPSRHALLPSDESDHLPKIGRVKVKVLQVLSACRLAVNLLEVEGEDGQLLPMATEIVRLAMEMALYFTSAAHRSAGVSFAKENDLVALETAPGLYQRARVEGIIKRDSLKQPTSVKVWMVDCGEWRTAAVAELVVLPEVLQKLPEQAAEVILCRAAPTDDDTEWSPAAYAQVCHWVRQAERDEHAGCYFVGDVVLSLHNTLWLDPLQARRTLEMSETDILVRSFRKDLVERRLAINNPRHLERLYDMCRDAGINVDYYQGKKPQPAFNVNLTTGLPCAPAKPRWQHLRNDSSYSVTFVSALCPSSIFVRLTQFERNLIRLNADIQSLMAMREAEPRKFLGEQLVIAAGAVCLAKFPEDGNWHRALVRSVSDDGAAVEVFFVDHGDRANVSPATDLVPITNQLIEYLPFMAIECSLAGIKPLGEESWLIEATDLLYDLTVNKAEMAKELDYRIVSKSKSTESVSGVVYSVVLIDPSAADDSVLNRVLAERGLAAFDNESGNHFDELPRKVPQPAVPPPTEDGEPDIELARATMPGKVDEGSVPEVIRLEDLAHKSVSLIHTEETVLKEGESSFDFEIDDVRSFVFRMIHGRAEDAEAKLQVLNELAEKKSLALLPVLAELDDQMSSTKPKPGLLPATASTFVPVYAGVPGAFTPKVVWYQELRSVHLSIEVVDVPTYHLETTATGIHFSAESRNGDKYVLPLDLFGTIQPERTEHSNTGRRISVVLHKIYAGNWPYLLAQGDRCFHWLRYNIDHATTSTDHTVLGVFDDCGEEVDEARLRNCVRRAQERATTTPHVSTLPADWRGQVVPHFQYEESDDEQEDDFIPPDKPYRFEDFNDPLI